MGAVQLWIMKILDGFLTLLGEIIMFFGVYVGGENALKIVLFGLFLVIIGQLSGTGAIKYENRKKLQFLVLDSIENAGRQFAYPFLIFVLYLLYGDKLFLALAFVLALVAFLKSLFIIYRSKIAEAILDYK
ncbi:hypothetical protein KJ780_03905 [Candidatus Micrarchaeota archaeon]|nr:hypothetical protein [Candidatus Micrarchaeota archaeon]